MLTSKGKHKDAIEMFKKALAIRQEHLGAQHLDTAAVHNNIGFVYQVLQPHHANNCIRFCLAHSNHKSFIRG